ncbi:MAG: YraN family protein [Desulfobacterota bacterium]|nr:YraN family protein [Thermodesulfobacteriota bacterium]
MEKKALGAKGEEIALRFLKKRGYRILERNYVCKMGEIDLIAKEKDTLAFVEVKTRRSSRFGPPEEAVDRRKQEQLSRAALFYLKERGLEQEKARFDVVAVQWGPEGPQVELIRNAFELQYL